jgi:hypothetical protein
MKKYRGFQGEISPLGDLGITRDSTRFQYNGEREPRIGLRATDIYQSSPKLPPPTEPAPVLEPDPHEVTMGIPGFGPGRDWQGNLLPGWTQPQCFTYPCPPIYTGTVSPGEQELEWKQYQPGGDGRAEIIEKTAKIDEAIERATGGAGAPPATPAPKRQTCCR